jgi:hypothetical protein
MNHYGHVLLGLFFVDFSSKIEYNIAESAVVRRHACPPKADLADAKLNIEDPP